MKFSIKERKYSFGVMRQGLCLYVLNCSKTNQLTQNQQ